MASSRGLKGLNFEVEQQGELNQRSMCIKLLDRCVSKEPFLEPLRCVKSPQIPLGEGPTFVANDPRFKVLPTPDFANPGNFPKSTLFNINASEWAS